jgi:hypothetical protein
MTNQIIDLAAKRQWKTHDERVRLKRAFDDCACNLDNAGHHPGEVTDAMIRSLCGCMGDREELTARIAVIGEEWFGPEEAQAAR